MGRFVKGDIAVIAVFENELLPKEKAYVNELNTGSQVLRQ